MSTRPMRKPLCKKNLFGYEGNASTPEYDPKPFSSSSSSTTSSDGVYLEEVQRAVNEDPENVAAVIHYEFVNVEQLQPIQAGEIAPVQPSPPRVPIEEAPVAFEVADGDFDGDFFDDNLEQVENYLTPCDDGNAFKLLHEA